MSNQSLKLDIQRKKNLAYGAALRKGKYHKFIIVALDANNNVAASSKVIHVATKGSKVKNYSKVIVSNARKFKNLKKGRTLKIKAAVVGTNVKEHVKLRYESSNPAVAKVTKSGKVKGLKKGKATITVYAQNGKYKMLTVNVLM